MVGPRARRQWIESPCKTKKFLLFAVCLQLADTSTELDTLRPVVRLGTFEHVVSPSRPEEQEVDYEVMARDYVKMAC
uniref:Uncharacterized protein n=1 Tax=Hyaloperonospora arabidopsidis (strain Emoy2) TaxID=559515 RepID=M4BQ51_HYAAE